MNPIHLKRTREEDPTLLADQQAPKKSRLEQAIERLAKRKFVEESTSSTQPHPKKMRYFETVSRKRTRVEEIMQEPLTKRQRLEQVIKKRTREETISPARTLKKARSDKENPTIRPPQTPVAPNIFQDISNRKIQLPKIRTRQAPTPIQRAPKRRNETSELIVERETKRQRTAPINELINAFARINLGSKI